MKAIKNLLGGLLLVIILIILDREIGGEKPVSTKRNTYVWAWVCILALAVLGLCNKCAFAQETVPIFYGALRPGILGQTVCNKRNEVAIIINDGYNFDSTELYRVTRHELIHVSQIKALGGDCMVASKAYMKDPIAQEVPAYCPELRDRLKLSDEPGEVYMDFVRHIYNVYGIPRKMSVADVAKRVEELCPTGRSHDSS